MRHFLFGGRENEGRPYHLSIQMNAIETAEVIRNTAFSSSTATGGPRINIDYRMQLIRQRESAAPFLSFMLNVNSEPTKTNQFSVFETRPNPKKSALTGSVAVGASANATVTWPVVAGANFIPGDIVRPATSQASAADETNEGIVTAVSSNNLTVRPNDPTLKICAVQSGEDIQIWGNSFAQGTNSGQPASTKPSLKTFYTQIFKHGYSVTGTQANNRLYGAPERDRQRGEKEIEHLVEIEKALLNGSGIVDTTNDTHPRTTIKGIIPQILERGNVLYYGNSLTLPAMFTFMSEMHTPKYAGDGKMNRRRVIASAQVLDDIGAQIFAKQAPGTATIENQFGVDVMTVKWFNGRIWDFVEDPILSDFLPGYAVVFQPRYIKLREFRPTRLQTNIQANNADYFEDQFLTELGLEVQLGELHGVMRPGSAS